MSVSELANRVIREQTSRRIFFSALVLALVVCLLLQAYVLPEAFPTDSTLYILLNNILLTLEVSIVTTLGTSILVIWFTPEVLRDSGTESQLENEQINKISESVVDKLQSAREDDGITIIPHEEIEETVLEAANGSQLYKYRGHLGRFPSGAVLPILVENSSEDLVDRNVHLLILDPTSDACETFVEYKRRAETFYSDENIEDDGGEQVWSIERVRNEIIGTIVTVYIYDNETLVDADVSLVPNPSLFRVELFDEAAIITRENPDMPAMRVSVKSGHYDAYKSDMWLAGEYGTMLPKVPSHKIPTWSELTPERVEELLHDISEEINDGSFESMINAMSESDWESVVKNIMEGNEHHRDFPYDNPNEINS